MAGVLCAAMGFGGVAGYSVYAEKGDGRPAGCADGPRGTSESPSGKFRRWRVEVSPDGHLITRQVLRDEKPWHQCHQGWEPEGVIWPTWPARSKDEIDASGSPLAGVQEYWSTVGNRLRDSAKWMAAVLGAALAAVIGTSPLTGMKEHKPQGIAIVLGAAGLITCQYR